MKHITLESINSTQTYLKDNLEGLLSESSNILVSTMEQPQGLGRQGSQWIAFKNSISFSFVLKPNEIVTLTPLEISVLISNFFENKFNKGLKIKWPNDIFNQNNEKVGGILCQKIGLYVVVGIGLNIGEIESGHKTKNDFPIGSIDSTINISTDDKHNLPKNIYQYILNNRMKQAVIRESWMRNSIHNNILVSIVDGKQESRGVFIGLGEYGEALLKNEEGTCKVFTGSLRIIDHS